MSNGRPDPHELLSAYHDGELSAADRDAAVRLLEESADARAELEDYRFLSETLRSLPAERVPEGLRAAVMRRIERESLLPTSPQPATRLSRPRRPRRAMFLIAGGLTAAAGVLLAFNLFDGRFGNDPVGGRPVAMDAPAEAGPESVPELAAGSEASFGRATRLPRGEVADGATPAEQPGTAPEIEIAVAGPEARPPADTQTGDIYRYLEQTPEGDIVVVEATVVDIRQALNQMQVLLHRNSIPTVPTTLGVGPETAAAKATASDRSLAIYVESEPTQMNAALFALGNDPVFLGFEVRGVLEAPRSGADSSDEAVPAASAVGGIAGRGVEARSAAGELAPAQSRFSVPEVRLGKEQASPSAPAPTDGARRRELLEEPSAAPEAPVTELDSMSLGDQPTERKFENGYQQVVPVPQDVEALLRAKRLTEELSETETQQFRYFSDAEADSYGARSEGVEGGELELRLQRDAKQVRQQLGQFGEQVERRHRMLVVLERKSEVTKVKADTSAKPPVEAPYPMPRKG